jgi:hypothetical protein
VEGKDAECVVPLTFKYPVREEEDLSVQAAAHKQVWGTGSRSFSLSVSQARSRGDLAFLNRKLEKRCWPQNADSGLSLCMTERTMVQSPLRALHCSLFHSDGSWARGVE